MATKNFGFPIDFKEGSFFNTELNSNGEITLQKQNETYDGVYGVYYKDGYWESKIYDLVDNYTSLENLSLTTYIETGQEYKAYTRTSNDGINWEDYVEIDYLTGKMQSTKNRYIQIKIKLISSTKEYSEVARSFNSDSIGTLDNTDYITTDGALQLKKEYSYEMTESDVVGVYKTTILSSKFKKIDKIRLEVN